MQRPYFFFFAAIVSRTRLSTSSTYVDVSWFSAVIPALLVNTYFPSIHLSFIVLCWALRFWTGKGSLQSVHNGIHHNLNTKIPNVCITLFEPLLLRRLSSSTVKNQGTNLIYAWHNKRFLDKGNPGICVESQKLLHFFTVGYFRDGAQLLKKWMNASLL